MIRDQRYLKLPRLDVDATRAGFNAADTLQPVRAVCAHCGSEVLCPERAGFFGHLVGPAHEYPPPVLVSCRDYIDRQLATNEVDSDNDLHAIRVRDLLLPSLLQSHH